MLGYVDAFGQQLKIQVFLSLSLLKVKQLGLLIFTGYFLTHLLPIFLRLNKLFGVTRM